ncbi:MAG TPA: glycosyltransferase family 2 protein [Steroidobacteraceae bacterium]|nr:glycosyltransferase family 2 protein [Steroidobacteraceae bacterium]
MIAAATRIRTEAPTSVGVVFTTYNRPHDLERVLAGYAHQTHRDFEIVIADDGSGSETRECIERAHAAWKLNIRHVWHEDIGFRKCRILNRAIVETGAEYLIFTDGDCIPHPEFVAGHLALARPGFFVSGGCVRLGESATAAIVADDILAGRVFDAEWLRTRGESSVNLRKLLLSADPWHNVMNMITTTKPTWNGHNASTWRDEVLAVNGFDERLGYGGLDREFGERLERCGMRGVQARYSLICLHLDHPRPYRAREIMDANRAIRRENAQRRVRRTAHGLTAQAPLVQRW